MLLQQVVVSDHNSKLCLYVATGSCSVYRIQLAAESSHHQAGAESEMQGPRHAHRSLLCGVSAKSIFKVRLPQHGISELGRPTCLSACGQHLCLGGSKGTVLTLPSASFTSAGRAASVMLLRPPETQFQRFIGGLFKAAPTSPLVSLLPLDNAGSGGATSASDVSGQLSGATCSLACALHADGTLRIWDTASHMQVLHQNLKVPEAGLQAQQMQPVPYESSGRRLQATGSSQPFVQPSTDALFIVHWAASSHSHVKLSSLRIHAQPDEDDLIQATAHESHASEISHPGPIRGLAATAPAASADIAAGPLECWVVGHSGTVNTFGDTDEANFVQLVEDAPSWESSAQASLSSISVSMVPLHRPAMRHSICVA